MFTFHFHQWVFLFQNLFFPFYTKEFNKLETNLQTERDMSNFKQTLKSKIKPKKYKHFNCGSKRGNSLLTQLRVGRSHLNAHLFSINLSDSDLCLCARSESVTHFLNDCFLYTEERHLLYNSIDKLIPNFSNFTNKMKTNILLNGINLNSEEIDSRNSKLSYLVQNFILKSKRFC